MLREWQTHAARLEMPVYPEDKFVEAVAKTVKANDAWVPPFGSGAYSLHSSIYVW